jgi:hypothetical protein
MSFPSWLVADPAENVARMMAPADARSNHKGLSREHPHKFGASAFQHKIVLARKQLFGSTSLPAADRA